MRTLLKLALKGSRPYVAGLVLLNLLFFSNILFTGNTLFYRDIGDYHYPLKKLVTEAYTHGEWPLWNPYIQFGQPLLGNPNAMALNPTQLLFQLLPFNWAFDLSLILYCFVGGLGAFYLARALGLSPAASLATGVAYNFTGVALSFVNLPLLAVIAGLLPWLAFLLWGTLRGSSVANLAFFSVAMALLWLSFEPLTSAAALLFLAPLGVYGFLTRPGGVSSRRIALRLLVAVVSSLGLAAAQLLPTLELLGNSGRQTGLQFSRASFWSVHPVSLTQMLLPGVWQDPFSLSDLYTSWFSVFFEGREPYIVSFYCGVSCLFLALLGLLFSEKIALKWIVTGSALVALLLALGKYTPLYELLYRYLPPFRFGRYPAKYLLTVALSMALLAGLGVDQLVRLWERLEGRGGKRRLAGWLLAAVGLLAASGILIVSWAQEKLGARSSDGMIRLTYHGVPINIGESAVRHSVLLLWLVVIACAGLALFSILRGQRRPWLVGALAVALIFFDLFAVNRSINPLVPSKLYEESPVTRWLLNRSASEGLFRIYHLWGQTPYRILGKSDSLIWHFLFGRLTASPYGAAADHIQYSSFPPVDRLETAASQRVDLELERAKGTEARLQLLAGLNTGYVLSMAPIASPLLHPQASFRINSDQPLVLSRLANALPRAYVQPLGTTPQFSPGGSRIDAAAVTLTRYTAGRVEMTVKTPREGMLVLLDADYPGWRVWVDAREGKIERIEGVFRGVAIPAGQHRVVFAYQPRSFRNGLAITLSTIAIWSCSLLVVWRWRSHRRKMQSAPQAAFRPSW